MSLINTPTPKDLAVQLADAMVRVEQLQLNLQKQSDGLRWALDYIDAMKREIGAAGLDVGEIEIRVKQQLDDFAELLDEE